MARLTVPMEHALKVLQDGQWHPLSWAVWEVSRGVPPNLAYRKAEELRVKQYLKEHPEITRVEDVPPRFKNNNMDLLVTFGAKHIARTVLENVAFERIRHKETGQRLVRRHYVGAPPPPEGYEHYGRKRSATLGKTEEEVKKIAQERTRKGLETRLRQQGIDPTTHVTQNEQLRRKKEWWANLSPEEKSKINSERTRKGWETRQRRQKEGS